MPIAVPPRFGLQQQGGGLGEALAVLLDHDGVGGELLAQRHGDGVLELGAAHLQYVAELRRFRGEGRGQRPQGVAEPAQSTLLGGRNTIEHHDELIDVCADGDAHSAAELSGRHWSELGGHINQLFDTNQFAEAATG